MMETLEEVKARQKKEVKEFDSEKRLAIKKKKGNCGKGKKGKEVLAALENDYATKEQALKDRHTSELAAAAATTTNNNILTTSETQEAPATATPTPPPPTIRTTTTNTTTTTTIQQPNLNKKSKAQRKRDKARLAERDREAAIAAELASAGPSSRDVELQALVERYLAPNNYRLVEIPADGHCLYRAVASQCQHDSNDYRTMRRLCAAQLRQWPDDYAPFAELENNETYEEYVNQVDGSSSDRHYNNASSSHSVVRWGGQLELRALATALQRPIRVYSADAPPLTMGDEYNNNNHDDNNEKEKMIRLSYHRFYYALGEHYNAVITRDEKS